MADTRYYYDFHYPVPLVNSLLALRGKKNVSPAKQADPAMREWLSRTRTSQNTTTEVITTAFQLPLSVSELSMEILRMPCTVEVWYQDRSNVWKPVLDTQRNRVRAIVARSDTKSWYKHEARCYPIVAKAIQFRLTRVADPALVAVPYPVGLRNVLIRRNVYDRAQGGSFEDHTDVLGNIVSRYVKDWDASKATDDNFTTFWRSAPQPDPSAVVSLYLDVRTATGGPQVVDKVYIDPVHTGQMLNLYYSSDDRVGTRALSPISISPSDIVDMQWQPSVGLSDLLYGAGQSHYQFPMKIGPQTSQAAWIGVEWLPSFSLTNVNLESNPQLLAVNESPDGLHRPTLEYDPGTDTVVLSLYDGVGALREYRTDPLALSNGWTTNSRLRIAAGWRYNPDRVWIKVTTHTGAVLAEYDEAVTNLPAATSFDGVMQVANVRGAIHNLIIKLEAPDQGAEQFLADPSTYCDPDPVMRDDAGRLPSTSLDNAIFAAPFLVREYGSGGSDDSHFADKVWTPVWRDYVATKGFLYLPGPTSMKYLKLEFTNLSEEPYPIYESGIETRYQVFPVSVTQQSWLGRKIYRGTGGFVGLGTFISNNGVRSVNWLDRRSVQEALGATIGPQTPPVIISVGAPYITTALPNRGNQVVESSRRVEAASSYVYTRDTLQPYILAADQYNTLIKAEGLQAIQPFITVPWKEIEAANPGAITKVRSMGTVPVRGTDWWIYPGQQLKVPASVMTKITDTATVTERKMTLERRVRFNTVSVHRYETRTVKRDAAVAYFAGVREVQPYTASYIPGEDKPVFDFPIYDPGQWTFDPHIVQATRTNALGQQEPTGPIGIGLNGPGSAFKTLSTQSGFTRLRLDYRDSGLLPSNSLWARDDDDDVSLSPYFGTLPENSSTLGAWSDASRRWGDLVAQWGSVSGMVAANISSERRYAGNRVLAFSRDADPSLVPEGTESGIKISQFLNFVPQGLFRAGVSYLKPDDSGNQLRLQIKRPSDGTVVLTETFDPQVGRWDTHYTGFIEIPPTLENGGFSTGTLQNWTPGGSATWTQDNTVGRTGTGSAKLVKTSGQSNTNQTLATEKMLFFAGETIGCSAWVKWSGVSASGSQAAIKVQAVYYEGATGNTVVDTVDVTDRMVTAPTAASTSWSGNRNGWVLLGGSLTAPSSGAGRVAFQVTVSGAVTAGTVWVDDVTADVPGATRQSFDLSLTVTGRDKDTLYVSDLYTQIAPIRYFVQLGGTGSYMHEVTDLRYTKAETVLTVPTSANEFSLRTVVVSPKAWAFGCTATPLYLRCGTGLGGWNTVVSSGGTATGGGTVSTPAPPPTPTAPITVNQQFSDTFNRDYVGQEWVSISSQSAVKIHNHPLRVPNTLGPNLALFKDAAARWRTPMNTDSVTLTVTLYNLGNGRMTLALCSDAAMNNWLGLQFWTGTFIDRIKVVRGTGPTTWTDNVPGQILVSNKLSNKDTFVVKYNNTTRKLSVFKNGATSALLEWTDSTEVISSGAGFRYTGLVWNTALFTSGPEPSAWAISDGV